MSWEPRIHSSPCSPAHEWMSDLCLLSILEGGGEPCESSPGLPSLYLYPFLKTPPVSGTSSASLVCSGWRRALLGSPILPFTLKLTGLKPNMSPSPGNLVSLIPLRTHGYPSLPRPLNPIPQFPAHLAPSFLLS